MRIIAARALVVRDDQAGRADLEDWIAVWTSLELEIATDAIGWDVPVEGE